MISEQQQYLIDRYPNLYPKAMHFDCGSGWFSLIDQLSNRLEHLIIDYKCFYHDTDLVPRASQVKEKYGTLRFYMDCATNEMYEEIEKSEKISSLVCEICGKEGRQNSDKWVQTLCEEHRK